MITHKLNIGNGFEFKVLDENLNPITYKLTVFKRKDWSEKHQLVFGYISKDKTRYISSTYSGGNTGFGISNYDINQPIPEGYEIVTSDIKKIIKITEVEENKRIENKKKYDKKQRERVEKLNKLPEEVEVNHPDLKDICVFIKKKAEYNPKYGRSIQGGNYYLKQKNVNGFGFINLKQFVTRNGKLQYKKFGDYYKVFSENPKEYLRSLLNQQKELNNLVNDI